MKKTIMTATVASAILAIAGEQAGMKAVKPNEATLAVEREARIQQELKTTGGTIEIPGSQRGCIRIVVSSKRVSPSDFAKLTELFCDELNFNFAVIKGATVTPAIAEERRKELDANLAVFIVDDKSLGTMLAAPEENWAIVNVERLVSDGPKPAFVKARTRKETLRAINCLTAGSSYKHPLVNYVKMPNGFDEFANERFPMDVVMRMRKYLQAIGVSPRRWEDYNVLIERGMDIAPTNAYQKAIYDAAKKRGAIGTKK